jgi:hypothetical protein
MEMLDTRESFFIQGRIDKNKRNEFPIFLERSAPDAEKRLRLISDFFEFAGHKINSGYPNSDIFGLLSTT